MGKSDALRTLHEKLKKMERGYKTLEEIQEEREERAEKQAKASRLEQVRLRENARKQYWHDVKEREWVAARGAGATKAEFDELWPEIKKAHIRQRTKAAKQRQTTIVEGLWRG